MPSLPALFNIIILLGALQGFIISVLLFFSRENKTGSRRLGILILLIAMASLDIFLLEQGMPGWSQGFLVFAAIMPMIVVMPRHYAIMRRFTLRRSAAPSSSV